MLDIALMQQIFNVTLNVCVACLMMSTGLAAKPSQVVSYFYGQRLALTIKIVAANIIIMPLLALLLIQFVPMSKMVALIVFLLAITPAAPLAPALVHYNKGDINWAICLMLLLTFLSLFSIPVLLLLGSHYYQTLLAFKPISSVDLLLGYVMPVFFPLFVGIGIRRWSCSLTQKMYLWINKTGMYLNFPLIVMVFIINRHNFAELSFVTTAYLCLFVVAISIVGGLVIYPKAEKAQYITAIISSGIRNFGIIFLLLNIVTNDKQALMQFVPLSVFMIGIFFLSGFVVSRSVAQT